MTDHTGFVDAAVAQIATWHGAHPPNDVALRLLAELPALIAEFERLRGTLRFEEEPAGFTAALLDAAAVECRP